MTCLISIYFVFHSFQLSFGCLGFEFVFAYSNSFICIYTHHFSMSFQRKYKRVFFRFEFTNSFKGICVSSSEIMDHEMDKSSQLIALSIRFIIFQLHQKSIVMHKNMSVSTQFEGFSCWILYGFLLLLFNNCFLKLLFFQETSRVHYDVHSSQLWWMSVIEYCHQKID